MKRVFGITALVVGILYLSVGCAHMPSPLESNTTDATRLFKQAKIDPAIDAAKKAVAEDPDNAGQAWYVLARSYAVKGKTEDARNAYRRALSTDNGFFYDDFFSYGSFATADNDMLTAAYHSWANFELGRSYYKGCDDAMGSDRAMDYFDKALDLKPDNRHAIYFKGLVYLCRGLYGKAIDYLDYAHRLRGLEHFGVVSYRDMAYAYLGLGDELKAFSLLKKAQKDTPGYGATYDRAAFYYALGDEKKLSELAANTGFLGVEYRMHAGRGSEQQKAIEVVRVVKDSPAQRAGLLKGDLILSIDGRPVEGLADLMDKVGKTPVGGSVSLRVRRDGKEEKISALLGPSPTLTPAVLGKEPRISHILKKSRAVRRAESAIKNGELRSALLIYSGYLHDESGRPIEYERDIIESIIRLYARLDPRPAIPEEARRHETKAEFYLRDSKSVEDYKQANAEFEEAARSAPWWADVYFNYAVAQQNEGDYKGAIENLKLFLLAAPDDPAVGDVRKTIYTLEARAEKYAVARRWEGRWLSGGSVLELNTRGDDATMTFIKVDKIDYNAGYRPDDTKLRGVIGSEGIKGTITTKRLDDADITRCFGKEFENDMTGRLSPDGRTITIKYTGSSFIPSTCAITLTKEYTMSFQRIP